MILDFFVGVGLVEAAVLVQFSERTRVIAGPADFSVAPVISVMKHDETCKSTPRMLQLLKAVPQDEGNDRSSFSTFADQQEHLIDCKESRPDKKNHRHARK